MRAYYVQNVIFFISDVVQLIPKYKRANKRQPLAEEIGGVVHEAICNILLELLDMRYFSASKVVLQFTNLLLDEINASFIP